MYKKIFKPILFKFNPEKVHWFFINAGALLGSNFLTKFLVRVLYQYKGSDISKTIDGVKYRTPIILSAGFDYEGKLINILEDISFGGIEIGSITAKPYEGNPKPNLTRLPKTESIIVNKGLKNKGVDYLIKRLKKHQKNKSTDFVWGISIARTNCKETSTIESGIADYEYSFKRLNEEKVGDYYTINISCPNSYGGETFADPIRLEKLLTSLDKVDCNKPIYIKMPISISNSDYIELIDVIKKHRINGIVVGNLQKNYKDIEDNVNDKETFRGGLSGKPCRTRSNELIKLTRDVCSSEFTIFGCGGISSPKDAQEKINLGADAIQLITGMIYQGPSLIKKICKETFSK